MPPRRPPTSCRGQPPPEGVVITTSPVRPGWPGELALIAVLLVVYDRVADLAAVRATAAVTHGHQVLHLEAATHLAVEAPAQRLLAAASWLDAPAALWYDVAHLGVTVGLLCVVWLRCPSVYRRLRTTLVAVNLLGLSVFLLYPVAPPRLLPGAGFRDVVALSHTPGAWEASPAVSSHANEYASVPSLHVAYALWVVLVAMLCTRRTWLRALAVGHLVLTTVVVVATGNHYLLDAVAGGLAVAVAWALTGTWRTGEVGQPAGIGHQDDVKMTGHGVKVA